MENLMTRGWNGIALALLATVSLGCGSREQPTAQIGELSTSQIGVGRHLGQLPGLGTEK